MKPTNFAYYLTNYMSNFLPHVVGASNNTISSYADTFSLLISFCYNVKKIKESKLVLNIFDVSLIVEFLSWIENERGCSISTRNQRLGAIHSFFRYLQYENPSDLYNIQKILSIPYKDYSKKIINYISLDGIECLFNQVDLNTFTHRKHKVILVLLYASAARVQEIVDLKIGDINFNDNGSIKIFGKGKKNRVIPLESKMMKLLKSYLEELQVDLSRDLQKPLFFNHQKIKMKRQGITYIFDKYLKKARLIKPELFPENLSPHSLRHSKATHMRQAGISLLDIRDFLGHEYLHTTEGYTSMAKTSLTRELLEETDSLNGIKIPSWQKDNSLLVWLKSL